MVKQPQRNERLYYLICQMQSLKSALWLPFEQQHCLMKKLKLMKQFNKISDEELAAYLEGMLSEKESARIDAAMDIDTLEILSVSRKAIDEFPSDNVITLPSWGNVAAVSIRQMYEPLAMAGFLGDSNVDETADEESDTDDE